VKNTGGLFVLGTERHDARRIDNQLRGRSGRQGDPGTTQFFVSLEDSLMRIFASDTIKRVMGTFGIPEDEPIYNSMITRSLEKAQQRIEELNFDARKHVLSYDDVLNIQRQSVYGRRRALLTGGEAAVDEELARLGELAPQFALPQAGQDAEPVHITSEQFTDMVAKKKEQLGAAFYPAVRRFLLQTVDSLWVDHLEAMEYLRSSVNLRAYGQRDPLVEYKKEGLKLFQTMEDTYALQIISVLPTFGIQAQPAQQNTNIRAGEAVAKAAQAITAQSAGGKKEYGRNDHVKITNGTETRELKFKKAEPLLKSGQWRLVEGTMETRMG
jgi:preprotein translocase subunit SecA